jgi:hypothetical protein
MPSRSTSIRLNTELADRAAKALGAKSRTAAIHMALREVAGRQSFKDLLVKNRGRLSFDDCDK